MGAKCLLPGQKALRMNLSRTHLTHYQNDPDSSISYCHRRNTSCSQSTESNKYIMHLNICAGQECDLFWSTLGLSSEIAEIVDYTVPVLEFHTLIISRGRIESSSAATWELLSANPMATGGLFLLMPVLALMTYLNERKLWRNPSRHSDFWNILWYYFGGIFMEPFRLKPISQATRIFIGFWWICVVILVSLIGGNLKADLAIANRGTIDTLQDILARPSLKPLMLAGSAYFEHLRKSENPTLQGVYQQAVNTRSIFAITDLIGPSTSRMESLHKGHAVLILYDVSFYYVLAIRCSKGESGAFYIGKQDVFTMGAVFTMTKGKSNHFKEKLNQKIRYFTAMQLTERTRREHILHYDHCFWKPSYQRQTGNDIILISAIWVIGMTLSAVVLMIEIATSRLLKP